MSFITLYKSYYFLNNLSLFVFDVNFVIPYCILKVEFMRYDDEVHVDQVQHHLQT